MISKPTSNDRDAFRFDVAFLWLNCVRPTRALFAHWPRIAASANQQPASRTMISSEWHFSVLLSVVAHCGAGTARLRKSVKRSWVWCGEVYCAVYRRAKAAVCDRAGGYGNGWLKRCRECGDAVAKIIRDRVDTFLVSCEVLCFTRAMWIRVAIRYRALKIVFAIIFFVLFWISNVILPSTRFCVFAIADDLIWWRMSAYTMSTCTYHLYLICHGLSQR